MRLALPGEKPVPQTTARYAHLDDDALRKATEGFGAMVEATAEGREAEVVPLPSER